MTLSPVVRHLLRYLALAYVGVLVVVGFLDRFAQALHIACLAELMCFLAHGLSFENWRPLRVGQKAIWATGRQTTRPLSAP